jgi:hypothetical protein
VDDGHMLRRSGYTSRRNLYTRRVNLNAGILLWNIAVYLSIDDGRHDTDDVNQQQKKQGLLRQREGKHASGRKQS